MKRLLVVIVALVMMVSSPIFAADQSMAVSDWGPKEIRQFYVTGSGALSSTLSIPVQGTQLFELISVEVHLSAAGGSGDFTITKDSGLGAVYDVLWLSQDMTAVTDLVVTYEPSEALFQNTDSLVFSWANAGTKTYGLIVKYILR